MKHYAIMYEKAFIMIAQEYKWQEKIKNLPGEAVLSGFGCTVLIAFIAEHINNYLAFSVCSLPGR